MSRGGRGGGRGGGNSGKSAMPMGSLTMADLAGLENADNLYPYMSNLPRPTEPSKGETRAADLQLEYLDTMRGSPYWPVSTQKKVKELPRYTDRYRPEEQSRPSLRTINLQRTIFPREIWQSYMQTETHREQILAKQTARRKRTRVMENFNWDEYEKAVEENGQEGGSGENKDIGRTGEEENDDDELGEEALGDYEEQEDDDYAQNYFDNGEGDDGDDDAGPGGGEAYE